MSPGVGEVGDLYYETDSVFTEDVLEIIEEGKDLDKFKDELEGISIENATFYPAPSTKMSLIKDGDRVVL